jgi:DNA-binding PadR family transcriptional regulator
MPSGQDSRPVEVVRGTLDMLILKTLAFGLAHASGIANDIRQTTSDRLSLEHESPTPALHRLQHADLIKGKWAVRGAPTRELEYYRLSHAGPAQLRREASNWKRFVAVIGR